MAWCEQRGDQSIFLTERERKDRFEYRAKNQTAVFQYGIFPLQKVETRKGIKSTLTFGSRTELRILRDSIWSSRFFCGSCIINQRLCVFNLIRERNRHCGPKRALFVLILKRKIVDQNFPSGDHKFCFVFLSKGKMLTLFGDHICPSNKLLWRLKKNFSRLLAPA